jgi:photosystem II stability/assembly factor-like uncharacterized protein
MKATPIKFKYIVVVFFLTVVCSQAQWKSIFNCDSLYKFSPITNLLVNNNKLWGWINYFDDKLLISDNSGNTWSDITGNIKSDSITSILKYNDEIVISCGYQGLYYSKDNGTTWLAKKESPKDCIIFKMIKVDNRIVAYTYPFSILISDDTANTWRKIDITIKKKLYPSEFAYKNGNLYLIGYWDLWLSTDKGETWTKQNNKNYKMRSIEVVGKYIIIGTRNGIIISEDKGKTFRQSNEGLPKNLPMANDLLFYDNLMFLAMSGETNFDNVGGVFVSPDTGKTWYNITNNLKNKYVTTLLIFNKYIFCTVPDGNPGRHGGVYRANIEELLSTGNEEYKTEISKQFYAAAPYPNPAQNLVRSKIYWNTDFSPLNADAYICNIYGQKVNDAGDISISGIDYYSAEIIWDCSKVSPGVYFIVINYLGELKSIPVVVSR